MPQEPAPNLALTVNGHDLTVSGTDFIPSSGGQQVILWIGYPGDYCEPQPSTVCHGFYNNPDVADDGTFTATFALPPASSGEGEVAATQWNAKRKRWLEVDHEAYTA